MGKETISRMKRKLEYIEKIIWKDEGWEEYFKNYFSEYYDKDETLGYAIRYAYDMWQLGTGELGEFSGKSFYSHQKLLKKYKASLEAIEELFENISPFFKDDKKVVTEKINLAIVAFEHLSGKRQRKQLFFKEAEHILREEGLSKTSIKTIFLDFPKIEKE